MKTTSLDKSINSYEKLTRKNRILLVVVGIALALGVVLGVGWIHSLEIQNKKARVEDVTKAYSEELCRDLQNAIDKSKALEAAIVQGQGDLGDFRLAARMLMTNNVSLIELAPNGVITQSYPEPSQFSPIDLNENKDALAVLDFAKEKDEPVLYGPLSIPAVGECIAITNPVYLSDESGTKTFWGYVILAVRVPAVYENTLGALGSFGYDYNLSSTVSPLSSSSVLVSSSLSNGGSLDDPVGHSFTIGDCIWTLSVEPRRGWRFNGSVPLIVLGVLLVAAIESLLYLTLKTRQQEHTLHRLAYQDALTGLLSRGGFMQKLDMQIQQNPEVPVTAAFMDLDDFKVINDVHGHIAGDQALIHMCRYLEESFPVGSIIGRTGGDEICVAITNQTPEQCSALIEGVIAKEQEITYRGKAIRFSLSAGYSDYPSQARDRSELIVLADEALYAAKIGGKHEARHYAPFMAHIKRERLGFSAKALASGIPGAFLIYKADPASEEILFANDSLIHLLGCDDFDDFCRYTKLRFQSFIYPEDRSAVEESIWNQIESQQKTEESRQYLEDYVEYRVVTKDGHVIPVIDVGRLIHDEFHGDIFFVFIHERSLIDGVSSGQNTSH